MMPLPLMGHLWLHFLHSGAAGIGEHHVQLRPRGKQSNTRPIFRGCWTRRRLAGMARDGGGGKLRRIGITDEGEIIVALTQTELDSYPSPAQDESHKEWERLYSQFEETDACKILEKANISNWSFRKLYCERKFDATLESMQKVVNGGIHVKYCGVGSRTKIRQAIQEMYPEWQANACAKRDEN
jgi:hypothetical protein